MTDLASSLLYAAPPINFNVEALKFGVKRIVK